MDFLLLIIALGWLASTIAIAYKTIKRTKEIWKNSLILPGIMLGIIEIIAFYSLVNMLGYFGMGLIVIPALILNLISIGLFSSKDNETKKIANKLGISVIVYAVFFILSIFYIKNFVHI